MQFINLAGYKFVPLDGLDELQSRLRQRAEALALKARSC
jgi:hypothetical protein